MKKVVNCVGVSVDLSKIDSIQPINYFHVPNWFFTVVLTSGEKVKIYEKRNIRLEDERNNLINQRNAYQNSKK